MKTDLNQIKTTSVIVRSGLIAIGIIGSMLIAAPATAASACKGLENSACSNNASCSWVEGYQRKDGRTVKSFCRTKSVSKKTAAKKAEASIASK